MHLWHGLEAIIERQVPLGAMTCYGFGGPAQWLARPRSINQLCQIMQRAAEHGLRVRTLGRGANLLVQDGGVDGVVIRLDRPEMSGMSFRDAGLIAGGGADMMRVVVEAARRGLGGLSCMAGIPGTIGGCLRGNAGGQYGEIGETVQRVTAVDRAGRCLVLERNEIGFGYRRSSLRDLIIVEAEFALQPGDPAKLRRELRDIWNYKKATQPLSARSCGCIFKNTRHAAAGALIDRAGLKGYARGAAQVSPLHANFIVARAGATATDVSTLIEFVRERVSEKFGVYLDLEVEVW